MISTSTSIEEATRAADNCTQCGHCCKYGSGFLIQSDLQPIADFMGVSKEELQEIYLDEVEQFHTTLFRPKLHSYPVGACIFLKENKCSIHPVKPLQCKTGTLNENSTELRSWFALKFQVNLSDPQSIREWASYLQHGGSTIPGGSLEELVPNKEHLQKTLRGDQ
jgi:Fe-S-cluster containining protein